jgi:ribosome maturation factor RimP
MNETADLLHEERLTRESGVEARVASIVESVVVPAGFRLVRVRLTGLNGATLQIMVERPDGSMSVDECEEISRLVSPALDVDDPIDKAYHLEISSPGIDRPLVRKSDFARWAGHRLKVETSVLVADKKRFKGRLASVSDDAIIVERETTGYGEETAVTLPWDTISDARLVLTDDLIRDALREDKKARKELKKRRRGTRSGDDGEQSTGA